MNNQIAIIISHASSIEKIKVLDKCIEALKNNNFKIAISSHISIPEEQFEKIDYFIYDKENPVIDTGENSTTFWTNLPGYTQQYKFRINYSYTIFKLIKNAISFAEYNGFEISHIVNYDYIIHETEIFKKHSNLLLEKDVCFYQQKGIDNTICPGIYSVKNKPLLTLIENINSSEKYFSFGITQFENFLYHIFTKLKYNCEDLSVISKNNEIDLISLGDKFYIEKLENQVIHKLYVFLSKQEDNYYIFINSSCDATLITDIKDFKFSIKSNIPNLFKIEYRTLINGFNINIPEFNFSKNYDLTTNLAECEIHDKKLIINNYGT